MSGNTRILIVDDDAFTRVFLRQVLESNRHFEVVGEADGGEAALRMVDELKPDVVTMDVLMPGMDGLETTRRILKGKRLPIIMVSELTQEDSEETLKALELGAVDFVSKSSNHLQLDIPQVMRSLPEKVHYWAKRFLADAGSTHPPGTSPRPGTMKALSPKKPVDVVMVAVSSGGPQVLPSLFEKMGKCRCPIILAQQMPAIFTEPFARRLSQHTGMQVAVSQTGMPLEPGRVHVAPGGRDILIRKARHGSAQLVVELLPDTKFHPSANALFSSAVESVESGVGVILTGEGDNGTEGAIRMSKKGWPVLVQEPKTCLVDTMPRSAMAASAASEQLSVEEIGLRLAQWTG